jgi:hypothetical protein
MPSFRLLRHRNYHRFTAHLPAYIQRKADWAQVLLGTRGRTPNVKSTQGYNARWRRTPVQGYHYYLWWIPFTESGLVPEAGESELERAILVHSIRHHDETDDPILLEDLGDFEDLLLPDLDPRFEEQREVSDYLSSGLVTLATIKGLPGSGKTVSLLYLVKDLLAQPAIRNLLYVTYTGRLKRAAEEFIFSQHPDLAERVKVRTLAEVEKLITNSASLGDPFGELADFQKFVDQQRPATLGQWKKYPQVLYTELRAQLFGRSFPPDFPLPDSRVTGALFTGDTFDAQRYGNERNIEPALAQIAVRLGDRMRDDRFFGDQKAAHRALRTLLRARTPSWLEQVDALVVDEVQDLTLLQVGLLGELARSRLRARPGDPFLVTVAGDESQVVQPSGFDWGVTKDLLRHLLDTDPAGFEYRHQRRSPKNLARLIDRSWNFYGSLPKALRPSANRQSFIDEAGIEIDSPDSAGNDDENGRILVCPLPAPLEPQHWPSLLAELGALPGRAVIDLTGQLQKLLAATKETEGDAGQRAEEVLFLPYEIKGLERATVLVHGLNKAYVEAIAQTELQHTRLGLFEARRRFDEIRVALSRSTGKLVLLDDVDAPVFQELGLATLPGWHATHWDALLEGLRNEEMSEVELVEGYLDEVDDLLTLGRWEQARQRNRRALEFAQQAEDRALQREAEEQFVRSFLQEADGAMGRGDLVEASTANRQAVELAAVLGDPQLIDDAEEQATTLRSAIDEQVNTLIADANAASARGDHGTAYRLLTDPARLHPALQESATTGRLDEMTIQCGWRYGQTLLPNADPQTMMAIFADLKQRYARRQDEEGALLAQNVMARYATFGMDAAPASLQPPERLRVAAFLASCAATRPEQMEVAAYIVHWLDEDFARISDSPQEYAQWVMAAQAVEESSGYPAFDERLWDLENRAEFQLGAGWRLATEDKEIIRFAALSASFADDHATASLLWERAGDPEKAATAAREAGELERAMTLLRAGKLNPPDELASAVKLLRQLEQMEHKLTGLRPAERAALAAVMKRVLAGLAAEEEGLSLN